MAVARAFVGGDTDPVRLQRLGRSVDWSALLRQAHSEGLAGLLAHEAGVLARVHGLTGPTQALGQAAEAIFVANASALHELAVIGQELARQGLEAVVLKGGALLHSVYHDCLHVRPLSDLDLLVRRAHRPAVDAVLRARGYVPHTEGSSLYVGSGVMIDLHDDLSGTARIRRRALAFRFDENALWETAGPLAPAALGLRRLSPTNEALHLAIHALRHGFARLIWLVDLALVLPRVEATGLAQAACVSGTLRALACAAAALEAVWRSLPRPPASCPAWGL